MRFEGKLIENLYDLKKFVEKTFTETIDVKIDFTRIKVENPLKILDGVKVIGVDGSHISFRELGVPFGGIQSARLWIWHGKGMYDLKIRSGISSENIELERFKLEMEMLKETMDSMDSESILFYDGSLASLYTIEMSERVRKEYISKIEELLNESRKKKSLLVCYVDRSYARDLGFKTYDSHILLPHLDLLSYTSLFTSEKFPLKFLYFRINPGLPVRIEFPGWIDDSDFDFIEWIMKVVYAECMISSTKGYPYILERAHKYASISEREKLEFIKAMKSPRISFKYISKMMR